MDTSRREMAATLGARARQLRIGAAVTLHEQAAAAGVLPHHIVRLERGKHVPSILLLQRLADAIGVDVAEYLKPPEREVRLLDRLRSSPAEVAKLLAIQERALVTPSTEEAP